jgi:formamidopyrimidine-DNA glycosylase
MPELPDVEIFKQYLDATSLHRTITTVGVKDKDLLKGISSNKLKQRAEKKQFTSSHRHGKYLFARLGENGWLSLHFGMTGFLKYYKKPDNEPSHDRLYFTFSNGYHLAFVCRRKLGEIGFAQSPEAFTQKKKLGPDAMDPGLGLDSFQKILSRSRGSIKGALMNQEMVAGVGNIYADEILFQAGVHPKTKVNALNEEIVKGVYKVIREDVLPTAIDRRADPSRFPGRYLIPRRKKGARCPKCNSALQRIKMSQRTTYLCPNCQRK